jgi:ABC-type Mn2+/Zn2+ transport system ATPase subunit
VQSYRVVLESKPSTSYRCTRAADSLDIDVAKKLRHEMSIDIDLATPWSLGVIVGASGSGKTTLAREMFGADCMRSVLDPSRPVIDQFPEEWTYDDCAAALTGVGLTSVPTWIRPAGSLSNGQQARADAALQLGQSSLVVLDEWTSVVDRTVAKVMSHCVAKHARRHEGRQLVLVSCHYDVLDWLNADWVIDCNTRTVIDRRGLWREFRRPEQLTFEVGPCDRRQWLHFRQYHYLSENMPANPRTFGLFLGGRQIGFTCYADYTPLRSKHQAKIMHANRNVIHPDFAGLGLGIRLLNATAAVMTREGFDVRTRYSSVPTFRAMIRDPNWAHVSTTRPLKNSVGSNSGLSKGRAHTSRRRVTVFTFRWVGGTDSAIALARKRSTADTIEIRSG